MPQSSSRHIQPLANHFLDPSRWNAPLQERIDKAVQARNLLLKSIADVPRLAQRKCAALRFIFQVVLRATGRPSEQKIETRRLVVLQYRQRHFLYQVVLQCWIARRQLPRAPAKTELVPLCKIVVQLSLFPLFLREGVGGGVGGLNGPLIRLASPFTYTNPISLRGLRKDSPKMFPAVFQIPQSLFGQRT